uniref:Uncharacterized protein n=1 Tax=Panagrolaimus sp. ES5 TaxID=591445 RepID=A0AC34FXS6_9BILA
MSVEAVQLNTDIDNDEDEEEEASTSSSSSLSQTWTSLPLLSTDNEDNSNDPNLMSPSLCKQGILKHFENLVNQLSTGWKYHVANTDGIKDSWLKFEDFYSNVCQFTGGQ